MNNNKENILRKYFPIKIKRNYIVQKTRKENRNEKEKSINMYAGSFYGNGFHGRDKRIG